MSSFESDISCLKFEVVNLVISISAMNLFIIIFFLLLPPRLFSFACYECIS